MKKSVFAGIFDSPAAEVSFAKLRRKTGLEAIKEIFADQPGRPKPVIEAAPPAALPAAGMGTGAIGSAAAQFIEAGIEFIRALASNGDALSALFTRDVQINRTVLSVP